MITFLKATNSDRQTAIEIIDDTLQEFGISSDCCGQKHPDLLDLEASYKRGYFGFVQIDDNTVGTLGLFPLSDEESEVRKMYLRPAARGKGAGKLALEFLLEEARRLGYSKVSLETSTKFEAAIGLYIKYGFQEYFGEGQTSGCDRRFRLLL